MLLLGAFALTALLLAVVGIYGVVSYSVTQRTRQLGVRMALGAAAADTLRLVLGRSLRLVAAGTACGLVASLAVTRVMSGLLYDVSPLDPVVFVAVSSPSRWFLWRVSSPPGARRASTRSGAADSIANELSARARFHSAAPARTAPTTARSARVRTGVGNALAVDRRLPRDEVLAAFHEMAFEHGTEDLS